MFRPPNIKKLSLVLIGLFTLLLATQTASTNSIPYTYPVKDSYPLPGMVAYYNISANDPANTLVDTSGYNYNGTANNMERIKLDSGAYMLKLDGTHYAIMNIGSSLTNGSLLLNYHVNTSSLNWEVPAAFKINNGTDNYLYITERLSGGKMQFLANGPFTDTAIYSNYDYANGQDVQLLMTWNNDGNVSFYVDQKFIGTNHLYPGYSFTGDFYIGSKAGNNGIIGGITTAAVFNTTLDQDTKTVFHTVEAWRYYPNVSISSTASAIEGNDINLIINLSKAYSGNVSVSIDTMNGTALANEDYTAMLNPSSIVIDGVGDSLTAGVIYNDTNYRGINGYGGYMLDSLPNITYINSGIGGAKSSYWANDATFDSSVAANNPDFMFLCIGTNDVGYDVPAETIETNIAHICEHAEAHGIKVVLMTIPSRRSISVAEMQNLTDANAWIRSYAAEQGYPLYDVFYTLDNPAWYNHLLSWYQGPLDGVHINKLGNEIWGRSIDTNMVQTHTVEFAPGETSKTITLHTTDDYRNTSDKEMYVRMSNPHNATYGTNTLSTVTIQESGNEFAIGFDYASYTVPENAGSCVLTVYLSKLSSSTVTVDYNTVDGSALSGVNYEAISGRVVFDPCETSKTLTIPIKNDFADTGNIDFTISLSNENGVTIGDNGTATITIVDTGVLRKTMNMAHSWNFVSFPLVNNSLYATDLGGFGVSRIAIYNNTTNAYNTYVLGFSAGDMPILPQKAYFVYSNGSQIIDYGTSPSAYNVTLYSGWNAIGWQSSTNSTASTVSASIPNIQRICRYNTSTGAYNTYVPVYSSADKDFTMSEGNGYFVYMNSPTPEELTIS